MKIKLSRYFKTNKIIFTLLILSNVDTALALVMWSLFMKSLADSIAENNFSSIPKLIIFGALFLLVYFLINNVNSYLQRKFLYKINMQLKIDLFDSIYSKDINTFNLANSAKYISILNNDIRVIETDYFGTIPCMINNIITAIIATIALFIYNPYIALNVLFFSLLPMVVPKLFGNKLSAKQELFYRSLEMYNTTIKDILNGFELLKAFNVEKQTKALQTKEVKNVEDCKYSYKYIYNVSMILEDTLVYLSSVIQLVFSFYLVIKGQITFGILFGSMQVANYVSNPINQLTEDLITLKSVKSVRLKIEDILNYQNQVENVKKNVEKLINPTPIRLKNLSFSYNDDDTMTLHNINLTFEKGKKYAIVGSSGSGKSTLLKLLMGYFDKYKGEIFIGEQNLNIIDKTSFAQAFSIIQQKNNIV